MLLQPISVNYILFVLAILTEIPRIFILSAKLSFFIRKPYIIIPDN